MSGKRQYKDRIGIAQEDVTVTATVTANWNMRDPEGRYRAIVRNLRKKYGNRFAPGEIRSDTDMVRFFLNNGETCLEILRPLTIASAQS